MAVNNDGKFTKKDEKSVKALEDAAAMDCTVQESCLLADISKQTNYYRLEKDLELKERLDKLKATPVLKARQTVASKLGELETAKWYLEKKRKKEFGNAIDMTSDGEKISLNINGIIAEKNGADTNPSTNSGGQA